MVANAVVKALAPRFKPSPEVKLAIIGMSSPDIAVRREAAGVCAGYLGEAAEQLDSALRHVENAH